MSDIFKFFGSGLDGVDQALVAREELDRVIAENRMEELEHATCSAVELTEPTDHALAVELTERSLALAPHHPGLLLLGWNLRANRGDFEPSVLADLVKRPQATSMRRRLYANLGVACLASQRVREGLAAFREAARAADEPMRVDVAVIAHGEPVWIQRMRALLQLDGLGEHVTAAWGIGGPRMLVLLEGLATTASEPDAMLLRSEVAQRLERGRAERVPDPDQPDVTLAGLLEDAADYARACGLDDTAVLFERRAANA